MPKCLHPPCDRLVDDALYCDEHKYIPHWTTNVTNVTVEVPATYAPMPQIAPSDSYREPHAQPPLLVPIILGVAILAILAVALIVILKLIF